MSEFLLFLLRVVKVAIVLLGAFISYLAIMSYRRHMSKAMLLLGAGFILTTLGSFAAGIFFELFGRPLIETVVIEASIQLVGFGIIVYALYGRFG